jgi:(2R)-sulfolactate sulfo-lyase subunit alpha
MKHNALMHDSIDDVAVVIEDITIGMTVSAVDLDGNPQQSVAATENIPLGHKIALRDLPAGHRVIKYGRSIGKTNQPIAKGTHVHTHNLKSERWA